MIRLENHPVARYKAVAASNIRAGTCILQETSLASILLLAEKGRRCDACLRSHPLRRCSGCASYWYCSIECQNFHWTSVHRQMCKKYGRFTASSAFQALAEHEKMDAILLSHLAVQIAETDLSANIISSSVSIFLSLLPGPISDARPPPVCTAPSSTRYILDKLYKRFGNNNFAIQSHLDTVGHGIFPNASQFFNHSCMPNAAAKYQFVQAKPVMMEVVALCDIGAGEEICLTYLDPALLQTRQQVFKFTYGFMCSCQSCQYLCQLEPLPSPPPIAEEETIIELGRALQEYVGLEDAVRFLPYRTLDSLPGPLLPVLLESYIASLSEIFSRTSHEGQYSRANEAGLMLLALYLLIYPENYPQIGVHLIEMAKTCWNELVTSQFNPKERTVKEKIQNLLHHARDILNVMGPEGDGEGRLHEADILQGLLDQ